MRTLAKQGHCAVNLNATVLGQAIAPVLFALFCIEYIWSPLTTTIEKYQEEIADGLASAEQTHRDLDPVRASVTDQPEKARAEVQVIIEQANKHRSQVLDEAKAKAEQERAKTMAQAQAEIEAERKCVREELHKQVTTLAVASAEKVIECLMDEAVNSGIVDKLVVELWGGRD